MNETDQVDKRRTEPADRPVRKLWTGVVWLTVVLVCLCQAAAIVTTRSGVFWDDVQYHNQFLLDKMALEAKPLHGVIGHYITTDGARPPLHRLVMIPVLLAGASSYSLLCLYVFAISLSSVWLAYVLGRRVGGQVQGLMFSAVWTLSAAYCDLTRMLLMEPVCYLAVFATLCCLIRPADSRSDRRRDWIVPGLALGIGALSKLSYVAVIGPVFVAMLVINRRYKPACLLPTRQLLRALVLGILVSAPWWVWNLFPAIGYAFFASSFERHAEGNGLLGKMGYYVTQLPYTLLGPAGAAMLVLGIVGGLAMLVRRGRGWTDVQKFGVLAGLVGAGPIVLMSFVGQNQNLRLVAPAAIPLCLALTTILAGVPWRRSAVWHALLLACLVWQGAGLVGREVLRRCDHGWGVRRVSQLDWNHLKGVCDERGMLAPKIAYWGHVPYVNAPYLQNTWLLAGHAMEPPVWLWHFMAGEIDWDERLRDIDSYDLVLAAPPYEGDRGENEHLDNAHNAEFLRRMNDNPNFDPPIAIDIPTTDGLAVLAFFRTRN